MLKSAGILSIPLILVGIYLMRAHSVLRGVITIIVVLLLYFLTSIIHDRLLKAFSEKMARQGDKEWVAFTSAKEFDDNLVPPKLLVITGRCYIVFIIISLVFIVVQFVRK